MYDHEWFVSEMRFKFNFVINTLMTGTTKRTCEGAWYCIDMQEIGINAGTWLTERNIVLKQPHLGLVLEYRPLGAAMW